MMPPARFRSLLFPLSAIYGLGIRLKLWLYVRGRMKQKRLLSPVISIGNLSVGGTGKTPMVLWLAERLLAQGKRVAILSRGYRGINGSSDEVKLMKQRLGNRVMYGVGKDRFRKGLEIEAKGKVDVFLLDDGFQHLRLARDADILLIDSSRQMANEKLLPVGNLREPVSAMARADLIVFTRVENAPGAREAIQKMGGIPVFAAETRLQGFRRLGSQGFLLSTDRLGDGPFFAFCGIGNPDAFFADLHKWSVPISGTRIFRDHHRYSARDVGELEHAAARSNAKALLCTEKDEQNLAGRGFSSLPVYVSVIDVALTPEGDFLAALERMIEARAGAAA